MSKQTADTILQALQGHDYRTIEIEWRLGRRLDSAFHPGVSKEHWERICWHYESSNVPSSRKVTIEHVTRDNVKKIVDQSNGGTVQWMAKWRILNIDSDAFRISVSSEYPPTQTFPLDFRDFSHSRHKDRVSFFYKMWRIDLTKATSNDPARRDHDDVTYEVEIELEDKMALFQYTMEYLVMCGEHLSMCLLKM